MKIALCDDNQELSNQAEELLLNFDKIKIDIDVYNDSVKLWQAIERGEDYQLFILDIEMPKLTVLELAEKIRELGNESPIIFLTSYREYMPEVFKLHTFDYLIKPIKQEELNQVMERVVHYLQAKERYFYFRFQHKDHYLPLSEILYFEKNQRKVIIYTKNENYELIMKTEELLEELDKRFVQVHQSYIVNHQAIQSFKSSEISLVGNIKIPVSRKYAKSAQVLILEQMRG